MKIGLVIYGSLETLSGGYLYDRRMVSGLRDLGETVEVISLPWRNYAAHLSDNLQCRLPAGFDLLIQDELNHPSLLAANRQAHPYPVISLVHHLRTSENHPSVLRWFYQLVERRYLLSVDGFIFNSNTTRQVVESCIRNSKPGIVAYPPTDRFGHGLAEDEIVRRAASSGPLRVLFLGNVIPRKGLHTLIEAIGLCVSPIRIDIVGSLDFDPVYARRMQHYADRISPKHVIKFHGGVWDEDLVSMLEQAHVLAVPSEYEGFGIVYLEGMAFGLPAIGTTAGAASELIQDGETGFLIETGNAQMLAERLGLLAADPSMLCEMSVKAKQRYLLQPAWQDTVSDIHRFLLQQAAEFKRM